MIKENFIFNLSIIFSTVVHVGGFGLFYGLNTSDMHKVSPKAGSTVISFEVGEANPAEQKNISQRVSAEFRDEENQHFPKDKNLSRPDDSRYSDQQQYSMQGSSGSFDVDLGSSAAESYFIKVRKHIEKNKFYPDQARKRQIHGNVIVGFYIDNKGIPNDVNIIKTSGYFILDKTAREMIFHASPFPVPPENISYAYIQAIIVFEI